MVQRSPDGALSQPVSLSHGGIPEDTKTQMFYVNGGGASLLRTKNARVLAMVSADPFMLEARSPDAGRSFPPLARGHWPMCAMAT